MTSGFAEFTQLCRDEAPAALNRVAKLAQHKDPAIRLQANFGGGKHGERTESAPAGFATGAAGILDDTEDDEDDDRPAPGRRGEMARVLITGPRRSSARHAGAIGAHYWRRALHTLPR